MDNGTDHTNKRYCNPYLTEDVMAKAKTDDLLEALVDAIINAAADFDMFATGKVDAGECDHESSYLYFRDILNQLGIPPQAITDAIDECSPDDPQSNLTERNAVTTCSG